MCDCIEKLKESYSEKVKKIFSDCHVVSETLENVSLVFPNFGEGKGQAYAAMSGNYVVKFKQKKKNGELFKNALHKHYAVTFKYCPFCGKSYEEQIKTT